LTIRVVSNAKWFLKTAYKQNNANLEMRSEKNNKTRQFKGYLLASVIVSDIKQTASAHVLQFASFSHSFWGFGPSTGFDPPGMGEAAVEAESRTDALMVRLYPLAR